ncbi:unnamed protein product [Meganyctiphanes norvegica]|uniref:Major facilitator superfamily (MFS) profile domain-containing protein n=1 Tax=Meganyctiphanes norvegica TaxID=48144 RepID=A0AAV2RQR3_MEGNR
MAPYTDNKGSRNSAVNVNLPSITNVQIPEEPDLLEEAIKKFRKPVLDRLASEDYRRRNSCPNSLHLNNREICLNLNEEEWEEKLNLQKISHRRVSIYDSTVDEDMVDMFNATGFGRWNLGFIILVSLCQASHPTQYFSSVFTNMPTDFRCEDQYAVDNNKYDNYCGFDVVSVHNVSMPNTKNEEKISNNICSNYGYDTSVFESTFTNEFHLVCDRAWLSQLYQFLMVFGSIFGNCFTGLSDTFGRANVIKMSSAFLLLGVLMVGFGIHVNLVLAGRFLTGFCFPILNCAGYTLVMETTPTKYRSSVGIMVLLPFDVYTLILGLLAYYVRQWRMLHLVVSLPIYLLPVVAMFIYESPRWLIQQGYFEEAYAVFKNASIMNKSELQNKESMIKAMERMKSKLSSENSQSNNKCTFKIRRIFKTLFASSKMSKISIVMPLLWFLMSLVYFGLPLNANSFTTNPFIYMIMLGCLQFPVDSLGHFVIKKFGNIKTCQVALFISGACMFTLVVVPEDVMWARYIFVGIAWLCMSLVFAICFIIANELFPTEIRSIGSGICLEAYYFGFLFGSFINVLLVDEIAWGFNVLCGLSSISAGFLAMMLPETQGKPLCETVDDVNNLS